MTANLQSIRPKESKHSGWLLFFELNLIYLGLLFFSGIFAGAGHGSYLFSQVAAPFGGTAPFSFIGLLLFPIAAAFLSARHIPYCWLVAAVLFSLHLLGAMHACHQADWQAVAKVASSFPGLVILFAASYVALQMFVWSLLFRHRHRQE